MQKSMVVFTFSVFFQKYSFWGNLFQKIFFIFLDRKYTFWVNLVQKIKIVSLSWNLLPKLFRICKIQWWWSLFLWEALLASFVRKIHLVFWCYLINFPTVYLQRLEASGFSCFNLKLKNLKARKYCVRKLSLILVTLAIRLDLQ